MKVKNFFKLFLINFSFLSVFFLIADIFISTINLKRSLIFPTLAKFNVPQQTCSVKTIYDASAIYKTNTPYLINYQRDKDCYRSKDNQEKNSEGKEIVLTIGGSTTDQRFVKEGDTFQDLLDQAKKEIEVELKFDLERNVKLVSFNRGKIDISFNEKLNKNFIKNLAEKLLSWTGERWIISLSKNSNVKSIFEKNQEDKNNMIEEFKKSKVAQDIQKAFPDAKLIDLTEDE